MPKLPSYRHQSIHLKSKSIDWFLYNDNFGIWWVKTSLASAQNQYLKLESFQTLTFQFQRSSKFATKQWPPIYSLQCISDVGRTCVVNFLIHRWEVWPLFVVSNQLECRVKLTQMEEKNCSVQHSSLLFCYEVCLG